MKRHYVRAKFFQLLLELVDFTEGADGKVADGLVHEQLELGLNVLLLLLARESRAVLLDGGYEVLQAFEAR